MSHSCTIKTVFSFFADPVYGLKSNIESASVAGFVYTEFELRLKWDLLKKSAHAPKKLE